MNELVPAFETSLFETSISEIGIEFAELGIDSILQDGLLKDIPIVGTIVNVGKFAQNIYVRGAVRIRSMDGDGELMLTILASFDRKSRHFRQCEMGHPKKDANGIPNPQILSKGDELVIVCKENELPGREIQAGNRIADAEGITTRRRCRWGDSNIRVVLTNA